MAQGKIRRYPIGIQTFNEIITGGYVYVDKTAYVYDITHKYKYVFLGRPRRFGKSLLASTFHEYFAGSKKLFAGLKLAELESEWAVHPVIHFDMSRLKSFSVEDLKNNLNSLLVPYEEEYGIRADGTFTSRFSKIVRKASESAGRKTVIIIDEYDAPLLNVLYNEQLLPEFRNILRTFYIPIKASDEDIRFVFMTGITKFSQLSIFSEINNLCKISMDTEYSGICGITQSELECQMRDDIAALGGKLGMSAGETLAALKKMYDGYHFSENSEGVYNPFSLISAFAKGEIRSYWYDSGTPSFLVEAVKKFNFRITNTENLEAFAGDFDVSTDNMHSALPLMYQAGYLTIKGYDKKYRSYNLAFPNEEVKYGFLASLIPGTMPNSDAEGTFWIVKFAKDISAGNVEAFMERLEALVSSVPYTVAPEDKKKIISEQSVQNAVFLIFKLMGQFCLAEVHTKKGRSDCEVLTDDAVYLFEFKLGGTADEALSQIDEKGYTSQYKAEGKRIVKIGVAFEKESAAFAGWKMAEN